jgi:hypothetical protein
MQLTMMASLLTNLCLDDRISIVISKACGWPIITSVLKILKANLHGQSFFKGINEQEQARAAR